MEAQHLSKNVLFDVCYKKIKVNNPELTNNDLK